MNHTTKNSFIIALACIPFIHVCTDTITVKDILWSPEALILASVASALYNPTIETTLASLATTAAAAYNIVGTQPRPHTYKGYAAIIALLSTGIVGIFAPLYLVARITGSSIPVLSHITANAYVRYLWQSIKKGIF